MWQRQRTPHSSLLLQSLEKLGVMHHSPSLSPLSLSISSIVSPSTHRSILLLSELRGIHCLKFTHGTQTLLLHNPPLLFISIFHHNSLKGGISKSTNGRDLIGKCYRGGGAVYCLLWLLEERHPHDGVGRTDFTEQTEPRKCRCFAWRWAGAEDELVYIWNAAEEVEEATEHG